MFPSIALQLNQKQKPNYLPFLFKSTYTQMNIQWISCLPVTLVSSLSASYYRKTEFSNTLLSRSVVSNSLRPHGWQPARLLCPWGFSRLGYWNRLPCPPSGDLPNPGVAPRFPALQVDSLLSEPPGEHKNTRVVAYPFFRGASRPRNRTGVSCIAGRFFTSWATQEALILEWVIMPSSRGSFQPRDRTQVSHVAGRFFTVWATREARGYWNG